VRPREAPTTAFSGGADAIFRPISTELPAYQGFSHHRLIVTVSRSSSRPTVQRPGWGRVQKISPGHGVSGVSREVQANWSVDSLTD